MGTSNFAYRDRLFAEDLSCGCAAEMEKEGETYQGCDCASIYYDDLLENIRSTMNQMDKKTKGKITVTLDVYPASHREWVGGRGYEGRILGRIIATSEFFGLGLKLEKNVIVRSGYYEGANIDHDLRAGSSVTYDMQDISDYDDLKAFVDSMLDDAVYQEEITQGQADYHRKNIENRFEQMEHALDDAFAYIATQNASEYEVAARFSNGETWYRPVKKEEDKLAA